MTPVRSSRTPSPTVTRPVTGVRPYPVPRRGFAPIAEIAEIACVNGVFWLQNWRRLPSISTPSPFVQVVSPS